jgi:hypothetical protein
MGSIAPSGDELSPLEKQLHELKQRFPAASVDSFDGGSMVTVPEVRLPDGWNKNETTVYFILPPGYPFANPDCFYADEDIRLKSGAIPQSAQPQVAPIIGQKFWFSWHLQRPWKANHDNLLTWMSVVLDRFAKCV